MASYFTNRGKAIALAIMQGAGWLTTAGAYTAVIPTTFFFALGTAITPPDFRDVNTTADVTLLTEINGYTHGGNGSNTGFTRNNTNFPVSEDDANDQATSVMGANPSWTASGGSISAAYGFLCDNDPSGGTVNILAVYDFGGTQTATAGNPFTLQSVTLRATKPTGEA